MRAVNLTPSESRGGFTGFGGIGPVQALVALLGIALLFVTIYALTTNAISDRKAKISTLKRQASQEQAAASQLSKYVEFEKLAQTRAQTVRQIASARFDWHAALSDLSKVVPATTSLQSLLGTVAPGATISGPGGTAGGSSGSSGASTSSVRGNEPGPAFELKGCTRSHDDVARLISRLRLINGVTRVTLTDSQKPDSAGVGASPAPSTPASGAVGCGKDQPTFDAVVFFTPIPNAGPSGLTSPSSGGNGSGAPAPGGSPSTPGGSSTGTSSSSQQVSNTSSGSAK